MCSADSTIEPAGSSVTGFLGLGFQRKCSDYQELKGWAELWRVFDGYGFIATPPAVYSDLGIYRRSVLENKCLSSFMSPAFKFISEFEHFFQKDYFDNYIFK